ncbi:MAG: hypothetical protein QM714_09490 [Nocardioides sp.]|uniref:HD domain-containing protein n=1 Tax=Nocardioides sp. TaxID=35761 RepID=UPI0039E59DE0
MPDSGALAARWPLPDGGDLRDALLAAWSAPDRGYHDLRHLAEVLDRLAELAAAGVEHEAATTALAAWFHDAVYDAAPGDEERSAKWATEALPPLVGATVAAEVARLVLVTERHRPEPGDLDGAALTDADLAILATSAQRYEEYAAAVRREYAHVSDTDFRAGRAAVLRELVAKPALFHTAYAFERWEARARVNVTAELARLTG